jgi:hypothetical protein
MKILTNVEEIFAKYDLKPIKLSKEYKDIYQYLREYPVEWEKYESKKNDSYFLKKYGEYIPKGWYGFDIGKPIIPEWMEIIDEIVELCIENDPDFEIHQIKLKFGAICFYVHSDVIEDIHDVELMLMNNLFDKALIY